MPHWLPTQLGVPCSALQAAPQAPQLAGSPLTSVSQPSRMASSLALQSSKPTLQVMLQTPSVHVGVPSSVPQALPQPLQLAGSLFRSISQPFAWLLSQSA